jgi:hypothetical protein
MISRRLKLMPVVEHIGSWRAILFPVRIDNMVMTLETGWPALIRNTRNIGDFRRWKTHDAYQQAVACLHHNLTATAEKPDASA